MKIKLNSIIISTFILSTISQPSFANDNDWIVRLRGVYVQPAAKGTTSIGGKIGVSSTQVPELDFTHFFTQNVAAELILATTKHSVKLTTDSGVSQLGSVKLLPPTITLQYHLNPEGKFRPYAGAGLNYTMFYQAKAQGIATSVNYKNQFGYAFQAGFDYMIDDKFGVNFDVKKIFLKTKAVVNHSITSKVRIDPWLIGAGMSYRF